MLEQRMTDYITAPDGIRIAYEIGGPPGGMPVLLIHGFGSSRVQNFKSTGWYRVLEEQGLRFAALDCRGHGDSDKPHDPAFYGTERLADDAVLVQQALGWDRVMVAGYSMGGFIGLKLMERHADLVCRLALCGVGETYLRGARIDSAESRAALADALLTDDKATITHPRGRMFRDFADQPGKDRFALAACMRALSPHLPAAALASFSQPVLVACGSRDDTAGRPEPLAAAFQQGQSFVVPERDHMTAVGDPSLRRAVADFFSTAKP
jgi:pimeloyl-ACP methyl ester carboxylesterase